MLIDTHCHLNYDYEGGKGPKELVEEALAQGVGTLITVATDHNNFEAVQKISESFPNVYHSIGVHPHEADLITPEILESMLVYLKHPKCVALGEIGLDYYYDHSDRKKQIAECKAQLDIALIVKKPVIIHSRDGEEDLLKLLQDYAHHHPGGYELGVIHCFSGTEAFAKACLALGFYISLSGIFTFKNTESLRQMVKHFPRDRLLVETDAPFLAPMPLRGKKCEPYMVKHTAMKLADVLEMPFQELAELTTANAKKCFALPN